MISHCWQTVFAEWRLDFYSSHWHSGSDNEDRRSDSPFVHLASCLSIPSGCSSFSRIPHWSQTRWDIYIYILFLRAQNTSNVRHQEGQSNQMPGLPAAGFFGCEGTAAWPRDVIHAILMWRYASLCVTLLSGCIHEKLFTEAARDEGWITLSIVFTLFIRVCACAWETVMVYFQLTKTIYDLHRIMICELFFFPEKSWMTDIYDTQAA